MSAININVQTIQAIDSLCGTDYRMSLVVGMTEGQKRETAAQLLGSMPTDKVEQFLRAEFAELFDDAPAVVAQPEWTDEKLRGIASDYFADTREWSAAMLCMRHLLMEQAKYQADPAPVAKSAGDTVTAAYGSVWRNGGLVVCKHFDSEPCPHQPERRCGECPGRAPPAAARVPLTESQMVDAVAPLCVSRDIATMLVANSMNEYRAIERAHDITGDAA